MARLPQTERDIRMLKDYSNNASVKAIADKHHVTEAVVYNVTKYARDSYWDKQPDSLKDNILRFYMRDYDSEYIADKLDVSVTVVIGFLLYLGKVPNDPGWTKSTVSVGELSAGTKLPVRNPQPTVHAKSGSSALLSSNDYKARVTATTARDWLCRTHPQTDVDEYSMRTATLLLGKSSESPIRSESVLLSKISDFIQRHWDDAESCDDMEFLLSLYACDESWKVYKRKITDNLHVELGEVKRAGKACIVLTDKDGYMLKVKERV